MPGPNGQAPAGTPVVNHAQLAALHAKETSARQATRAQMVQRAISLTQNLGGGLTNNIGPFDLVRGNLYNLLLDGPRDIDAECGYPAWLYPQLYKFMYDREGIARRVVDCEPDETWTDDPELYEDDDPEVETPFEQAWDTLLQKFNLWHWMHRADVLSGIGQFGIILLGINDGKDLREPVDGVNDDGTFDPGVEHELLYLRVFDESVVFVKVRDIDQQSPRYQQAKMYTIQFRDFPNWGVQAGEILARDIHWSRVIHIADIRFSSEVYGTPRMQPVYNRLYDLRKIYSSSGEAFWKGAFPGIAFEVNPEVADQGVQIDQEELKQQMADFQNGLQRYLAITGVSAKSLPPTIVDPMATAETHLKAIAIAKDIPYRVLFGSEEAVLAGNQDSRKWNKKLARRQTKYVNPMIIRPFVDRLIGLGILPPPEDGYQIDWPDLNAPTDEDKANIAALETQAMAGYVTGGVSSLMAPREYLTHVLEYSPDEADAILEASSEFAGDEEEPLSAAGQQAMQMEQMEAEAALMPKPPPGGSKGGEKAAKSGKDKKGKKKQNTRPTRNTVSVDNASLPFDVNDYTRIGHPDPLQPDAAAREGRVQLWRMRGGSVQTATAVGQDHSDVWPDITEQDTAGRIDHAAKMISVAGSERKVAYAAGKLAKMYPAYEQRHFHTHNALPGDSGGMGPTDNATWKDGWKVDDRPEPARQVLKNPSKGDLQGLLDTVHHYNTEHSIDYSPLKIVLRGAANDDGSEHVWGSSFEHEHRGLKQGNKDLEHHLYVKTSGEIVKMGRGGNFEPHAIPGIGSKLKPVKAMVANADARILSNPSKDELQAHLDTVYHSRVDRNPAYARRNEPILRGAHDPATGTHRWGDSYEVMHHELLQHGKTMPANSKSLFAYADGKISDRETGGRHSVPGIGNAVSPVKKFVANLEPSRKQGRDQQDDQNEYDPTASNPGASPDNGDALWTPNLAREGVKNPVDPEMIQLPSINAAFDHYTKIQLPYEASQGIKDRAAQPFRKMSSQERADTEGHLGALSRNGYLFRNMQTYDLHKLVQSGHLKSQFETGTSGGMFDPTHRQNAEHYAFGAPENLPAEHRPIYGYLHSSPHGPESGQVDAYGGVRLRFKPELRPHSSLTVGDSLYRASEGRLVGSPVNKPTIHSIPDVDSHAKLMGAKKIEDAHPDYTEAQIHRKPNGERPALLHDIHSIIVPKGIHDHPEFQKLKEEHFDPAGIKVVKHGTGGIWKGQDWAPSPRKKEPGEFLGDLGGLLDPRDFAHNTEGTKGMKILAKDSGGTYLIGDGNPDQDPMTLAHVSSADGYLHPAKPYASHLKWGEFDRCANDLALAAKLAGRPVAPEHPGTP